MEEMDKVMSIKIAFCQIYNTERQQISLSKNDFKKIRKERNSMEKWILDINDLK